MRDQFVFGVVFGVLTLGLVAAGHLMAGGGRRVLAALPLGRGACILAVEGALAGLAVATLLPAGDAPAAQATLLVLTLGVAPLTAAALLAPPSTALNTAAYGRWWLAAFGVVAGAGLLAAAVPFALSPAIAGANGWEPAGPRSPFSFGFAAASLFVVLRGSTELVRFVRRSRAEYLPRRSSPATRLPGLFYPLLTAACGALALMLASGIALSAAQDAATATLLELVLRSLPSALALLLAGFFSRFVAAAEPSARVFTVLCLLFAAASNRVAPPDWDGFAEPLRFAALILAAPVTLHFALLFPQQEEALPRSVVQHWSWRLWHGVEYPWPVYVPLAACLPVAMGLPVLSRLAEPPVALLGLLAGTYLLTTLAPMVAAYAFTRTWVSLSAQLGPPEAAQRAREQLAWVALGGLLAAASSLLWTLLGPLLSAAFDAWSVTVYWGSALLLPLGVAVAIVRHRLWDVQRLLNYALVHTCTLAAVGLLESAVFGAADSVITSVLEDLRLPDYVGKGVALMTAGVIYNPLKGLIKKRVDALFSRWLRWPARG